MIEEFKLTMEMDTNEKTDVITEELYQLILKDLASKILILCVFNVFKCLGPATKESELE